jgi:hypothetical protein
MSCSRLDQSRMLELPTKTIPSGLGLAAARASNAAMSSSQTSGSSLVALRISP